MKSQIPNLKRAGLYLHFPFCVKKCSYCDFFSTTDLSLKSRFLDSLYKEAALLQVAGLSFDTIYMGGGTPSLFTPSEIGNLIDSIHRSFTIQPNAEITLEVNPGTVNRYRLEAYRKAGVNRINIGVQSFQNDRLAFLGRIHLKEQAVETIRTARESGYCNLGIDLIYGLPGETRMSLTDDLNKAVSFDPEHLSCYLLTYEPGTRLTRYMQEKRFSPISDEECGNLLETTVAYLNAEGYVQYELSNFARSSEYMSRHNRKYWDFTPYLGLGPSAHSFIPPKRRWNHSSIALYTADLESGKQPVAGREVLSRQQQIIEAVYLGLRKTEGINMDKFERVFSCSFRDMFRDVLKTLTEDERIVLDTTHCRLSRKGIRFADSIAKMLISVGKF